MMAPGDTMSDDLTQAQRALNTARLRQRRRAMGPPLDQTDADLTVISEVGPSRLAEIEAFIRDAAGQLGVDLLRAE